MFKKIVFLILCTSSYALFGIKERAVYIKNEFRIDIQVQSFSEIETQNSKPIARHDVQEVVAFKDMESFVVFDAVDGKQIYELTHEDISAGIADNKLDQEGDIVCTLSQVVPKSGKVVPTFELIKSGAIENMQKQYKKMSKNACLYLFNNTYFKEKALVKKLNGEADDLYILEPGKITRIDYPSLLEKLTWSTFSMDKQALQTIGQTKEDLMVTLENNRGTRKFSTVHKNKKIMKTEYDNLYSIPPFFPSFSIENKTEYDFKFSNPVQESPFLLLKNTNTDFSRCLKPKYQAFTKITATLTPEEKETKKYGVGFLQQINDFLPQIYWSSNKGKNLQLIISGASLPRGKNVIEAKIQPNWYYSETGDNPLMQETKLETTEDLSVSKFFDLGDEHAEEREPLEGKPLPPIVLPRAELQEQVPVTDTQNASAAATASPQPPSGKPTSTGSPPNVERKEKKEKLAKRPKQEPTEETLEEEGSEEGYDGDEDESDVQIERVEDKEKSKDDPLVAIVRGMLEESKAKDDSEEEEFYEPQPEPAHEKKPGPVDIPTDRVPVEPPKQESDSVLTQDVNLTKNKTDQVTKKTQAEENPEPLTVTNKETPDDTSTAGQLVSTGNVPTESARHNQPPGNGIINGIVDFLWTLSTPFRAVFDAIKYLLGLS
jgi:hypothetical protein